MIEAVFFFFAGFKEVFMGLDYGKSKSRALGGILREKSFLQFIYKFEI
jgi:hypothetical protein